MDVQLLIGFAVFLLLAGLGLIYVTLRRNKPFWPQDAFQWLAVGLSALLVVTSVVLITMLASMPEREVAANKLFGPPVDVTKAALNQPAQDFQFRRVADDEPLRLSQYEGQVVLLNFWATWCIPCLTEMPELNRLQEAYEEEGLVVLTVSDEPREDVQDYDALGELKTVSGYLSDASVLDEPFRRMIEARPMTFVIDREGIIRESWIGAATFETFSAAVEPYLE